MAIQFSPETIELLKSDIDQARVKSRTIGGGQTASYVETHDVINQLNAVFGFGGWDFEVVSLNTLPMSDSKMAVYAKCRLTVQDDSGQVIREEVGVDVMDTTKEAFVQMALKGVVSDGLKRCSKSFGNQFGLSLYEKAGGAPAGNSGGGQASSGGGQSSGSVSLQCEACGEPIEPWKAPDGNLVSAEVLAKRRKTRYGKALCYECTKSATPING